jgi:hypothetical protein
LDHPRSGDVILTSTANSWQSYYWWNDDAKAPQFATTVDIHKKPGYDPVELFFDFEKMEVPLDANLIKGSHGYDWGGDLTGNPPGDGDSPQAVLMTTLPIKATKIADTEVFDIVMNYFQRPLP